MVIQTYNIYDHVHTFTYMCDIVFCIYFYALTFFNYLINFTLIIIYYSYSSCSNA